VTSDLGRTSNGISPDSVRPEVQNHSDRAEFGRTLPSLRRRDLVPENRAAPMVVHSSEGVTAARLTIGQPEAVERVIVNLRRHRRTSGRRAISTTGYGCGQRAILPRFGPFWSGRSSMPVRHYGRANPDASGEKRVRCCRAARPRAGIASAPLN